MRHAALLVLSFLSPLALLAVPASQAGPCAPTPIVPEIHTASVGGTTQIPVGLPDDSWYVASTPFGSASYPARSIDDHSVWVQTTGNPVWYANWINAWGRETPGDPMHESNSLFAPPGPYVYAVDFTLTPADLAAHPSFSVNLRYASDDAVTFDVNGGPTFGGPGAFTSWSSASYIGSSGIDFVAGTNTLYARVTNLMLWTGLLVVGSVQGNC